MLSVRKTPGAEVFLAERHFAEQVSLETLGEMPEGSLGRGYFDFLTNRAETGDWEESVGKAWIYWRLDNHWALGAEWVTLPPCSSTRASNSFERKTRAPSERSILMFLPVLARTSLAIASNASPALDASLTGLSHINLDTMQYPVKV